MSVMPFMGRSAVPAAILAALLALSGCGGGNNTSTEDKTDQQGAAGQQQFNAADVTFAQEMIPHHVQGVQMAEMAEKRAETTEVRRLARKIEAAQEPEIEQMAAWLEAWGEEVPQGVGHSEMGHGGGREMPGMMSGPEMGELRGKGGGQFDRMFLVMMIDHHEGAIEMARTEQQEGRHTGAVDLAERIEKDQAAEIEQMRKMLSS